LVYGDFLFIGDRQVAANEVILKDNKITCIVNASGKTNHFEGSILYFNAPSIDSPDFPILKFFDESSEFIESAHNSGKKILVHCQGGVSRSPTIVLAYLVKQKQMSLLEAFRCVKAKKSNTNPNEGFCVQLLEYEMRCRGSHSMVLKKDVNHVKKSKEKEEQLSRNLVAINTG